MLGEWAWDDVAGGQVLVYPVGIVGGGTEITDSQWEEIREFFLCRGWKQVRRLHERREFFGLERKSQPAADGHSGAKTHS